VRSHRVDGFAQTTSKLLEKIEELSLYVIDINKRNARLEKRIEVLEKKRRIKLK
jgi:hypothetical protein